MAARIGSAAAWLSRALQFGQGGVIGGRLVRALDPGALRRLSQGRLVVLVTGNHGTTTAAGMLAAALEELGEVARNESGAILPAGLVAALAARPDAPIAVLGVDERHFAAVATTVRPGAAVLLNLDRTDPAIHAALAALDGATTVANCDDVLISAAAQGVPDPVWVSAGSIWRPRAARCPGCDEPVSARGDDQPATTDGDHQPATTDGDHQPATTGGDEAVWCRACGMARPRPRWTLDGTEVVGPDDTRTPLVLRLPGRANARNAAMAVATAVTLGVPVTAAVSRIGALAEVAGRFRTVPLGVHEVRLLLARNPAGWADTLDLLTATRDPVVITVNARPADGRDPCWLWDVPFERLRGRSVVAAGERATDLAVRLTYADVPHVRITDPWWAVELLRPGHVDLVGDTTAFRELVSRC
jgi:lipid II isoglutaminyl synthase (glutamine-hydrolysing)